MLNELFEIELFFIELCDNKNYIYAKLNCLKENCFYV